MQNLWSSTVKQIIYANILQLVCGVLAGFYSLVAVASFVADSASGVASGGLMSLIFDFGAIGGFIWYFVKVIKFSQIQGDDQDTAAIDKLKIAILISLVAAVLALIPGLGWLFDLIGGIASAIMALLAFSDYSRSKTLPKKGVEGAGYLKIYAIIALVGVALSIIPVIGTILSLICSIVAIIFMFMGWSKVASSCPQK